MSCIFIFLVSLLTCFAPLASSTIEKLTYTEAAYGLRQFIDDPNRDSITFTFEGSEFIAEKYFGFFVNEISFYDPTDMPQVLWWKEAMFSLSDTEDYLSLLRKTKQFTGSKVVRLLKAVQRELRIEKIELFDGAGEESCFYDGRLCSGEECHDFSLTSVFLHGKKYYEKYGARPNENQELNEAYRLSADFIFHLPLCLLIDEVKAFQDDGNAEEQLEIIKQCLELTGMNEQQATCSELFREVYRLGKLDKTAHLLYHDFKNNIIHGDSSYLKEGMMELFDEAEAAALFSASPEQLQGLPKGTLSMLLVVAKKNVEEFYSFAFYLSDLDQ